MTDATTQLAAAYRYKVGDILVTAVHEGMNAMPLKEGFVRNAPFTDVQAAMAEDFQPTDTLNITFTPLVIQTGSETVVLDTGFADNGPPTAGFMQHNMRAAGIAPEDVTKVVISHFHGDHIAGLTRKDGSLSFPNAEVLVPEEEWTFWTDEAKKAAAPDAMKANFDLVANKFDAVRERLVHYAWGKEVATGVTALDAKGHTPGHTAYMFASGNDQMVFIADVTNHPALFVRHPDWSPAFDIDAEGAIATRRRILDMICADRLRYAGYHIPFPAVGHIEKDGNGYRHVPAQWMPLA